MSNSTVFKIEDGKFGLSLTDPAISDVCGAQITDFTDFTCRITDGALNASPNVSSETTAATWCSPEQTTPTVGETSYNLSLSYLQDPNVVDGLARFLFEHDAKEAYFFMGLDGDNPPKAVGKLRLVSGAIGGAGRTTLTASVSLPLDGKPAVCFGDANTSAPINNPADPMDVTANHPLVTGAPAADLATLKADGTIGDGQYSGPTFTAGQYIVLTDGSKAHYTAAAWSAGPMPTA